MVTNRVFVVVTTPPQGASSKPRKTKPWAEIRRSVGIYTGIVSRTHKSRSCHVPALSEGTEGRGNHARRVRGEGGGGEAPCSLRTSLNLTEALIERNTGPKGAIIIQVPPWNVMHLPLLHPQGKCYLGCDDSLGLQLATYVEVQGDSLGGLGKRPGPCFALFLLLSNCVTFLCEFMIMLEIRIRKWTGLP